jgi:hypothetical protein
MRKTLLGFGLTIAALVLSGCGQPQTANQPSAAPAEQKAAPSEQKDNSIVSSIKDAMGSGKQMKCTYSTTVNGSSVESIAYVDGNKLKSSETVAGKNTNMLFDGNTTYTWMDGQTKGSKMTISCINDLKASAPKGQQINPGAQSPEDQINNATDVSCVAATGTDFSVPASITFTDNCEALKKSMEAAKDIKANLPANLPANMPNIPNVPNLP